MSIKQTGPRFVVAALVLLGSFFFVANSASAATYYVRTDGDSTNCTGLSDAAYPGSGSAQVCAWATVAKVNSVTYTAGDMVRFKRGGTWSGTQLSPKSNVTYAATVEDGDKPILTTSATTRTVFLSALQGVTLEDLDVRGGTSAALQINSSGNSTPITLNRIDVSGGGSYQVLRLQQPRPSPRTPHSPQAQRREGPILPFRPDSVSISHRRLHVLDVSHTTITSMDLLRMVRQL